MRVYNPLQHCLVELDACAQAAAVDRYTPVRNDDGKWFVLELWTGRTETIETLSPMLQELVRSSIQDFEAKHPKKEITETEIELPEVVKLSELLKDTNE